MYKHFFKRFIDIVASLIGIIVLSPVYLILAILIRVKLGGPVLFKQRRPGKNEKIFTMYKFRTMTNAKDEDGNYLPDVERMTKFGSFLRKTSMDELPELFNILKGDMSLVGPRPLLVQYLDRYDSEQKKRHDVRPGLTGLAQINGRNAVSWNDKFNFDVEYVTKVNFLLDIKILLLTVVIVLKRSGVTSENSATAEEFRGNHNE